MANSNSVQTQQLAGPAMSCGQNRRTDRVTHAGRRAGQTSLNRIVIALEELDVCETTLAMRTSTR